MTSDSSTALITGGTSGIGRATANKLVQLGIHAVVVGRNAEREKQSMKFGGRRQSGFHYLRLRDAASAREVANKAIELGNSKVDIWIKNYCIYPFCQSREISEGSVCPCLLIKAEGPYFPVSALAPIMAKRGKGAIVNVSTMVADCGAPGMSLYGSRPLSIC